MRKILSLSLGFLVLFALGCNNQPQQIGQTQVNANTNAAPAQNGSDTVSSHSAKTESAKSKTANPAAGTDSSAQDSSPMAKPIDVAEMTAEIEKSEKAFNQKPKDETAKSALAKAYFVRAFALTEAAQYRAALGDFRKGLKLSPNDDDARNMHDEILRIFASINREPPREGEEPKPLPFEKKKT